jgi:preprotein translocase subunit YajC
MALIPIILLFAVMYALLIRPQQKRVRQHAEFVSSLRVGDDVITSGGAFGTISRLDDESAWLDLAPGTSVRFLRSAITRRAAEPDDTDTFDTVDEIEEPAVEPPAVPQAPPEVSPPPVDEQPGEDHTNGSEVH